MMKPTGLYAATGALILLGGAVWWSNKHPKSDSTATPASPKILTAAEDQIEGIRIARTGVDPVVLKKIAGTWTIAEPKAMPADQDAVRTLTGSLAGLTADRTIDQNPNNLTEFGLSPAAGELDVTLKGGKVHKLLLGSDTPSGSDTYSKLENQAAVYTIPAATRTSFDKTANDLRDKRLLPFNQDKVTSITVTSKGPAYEFGKNGQGEWQIVKPKPMRADPLQVDDLVRKLKDAKMDLTAAPDAAEFASAPKVASVSVSDNTGTQSLELRKAKDNTYYAKSSAVEGIYKLAGDLGDGLKDKDVDGFRNKKLFDFGFNDPSKVEIDGAAYSKSGDKWNGPSGAVDPAGIQAVVDKLRDLSASGFAEKASGTQAMALAVTSGDNHKLEKVTVNKSGDAYNAVREGEPAVYVIDAKNIDDVRKAVAGIKPYQAPKPQKK